MHRHRPPDLSMPEAASASRAAARRAGTEDVLADAAMRLRGAIDAAARRARALGRPILAWTTAPIPRVDPVDVFSRSRLVTDTSMVWVRPSDRFELVGVGSAWAVTGEGPERFTQADAAWQSVLREGITLDTGGAPRGAGPLAMMGFAFAPRHPAGSEWTGYPAGALFLPRLSIMSAGGTSWITLAAVADPARDRDPDDDVRVCLDVCAAALGGEHAAEDGGPDAGEYAIVSEFPAATAWEESVRTAARAIRAGRLQKVVLARGIRVRAGCLDPIRALRRLRAGYRECTVFAAARGTRCFLGATPERLVRLRGGEVAVAAIAGSAPRGRTEEEDQRLGERLRASAKDRIEHAAVVDALRDALQSVCTALPSPAAPGLLKISNVQHLHTPMAARLRGRHTLLDLVDRLHPTPAVGGVPRDAALRWIDEHEGWDRGWYGGPVGWMDSAGEGECAVAIRSALLRGTEALLFAGCGIVADSDPGQEYAEASLKLEAVLSALTGTRTGGDG